MYPEVLFLESHSCLKSWQWAHILLLKAKIYNCWVFHEQKFWNMNPILSYHKDANKHSLEGFFGWVIKLQTPIIQSIHYKGASSYESSVWWNSNCKHTCDSLLFCEPLTDEAELGELCSHQLQHSGVEIGVIVGMATSMIREALQGNLSHYRVPIRTRSGLAMMHHYKIIMIHMSSSNSK